MASPSNTVDIALAAVDFRDTYGLYLTPKQDPPGREVPLNAFSLYFGAGMCNWIEDVLLRMQAIVGDELQAQGMLRLGEGRVFYTVQWPEGVVTAPPGSLALRSNGRVYVKATGSGNTGWARVASDGQELTDQNLFPYSAWGDSATWSVDAGSRDSGGSVTITPGGLGIGANPEVQLTFASQRDSVPGAVCSMIGGSGTDAFVRITSRNTNELVMQYRGTPVAGETYQIAWVVS